MHFKITSALVGGDVVMRLEGRLDLDTSNELHIALTELLEAHPQPRIIADLSELDHCDSTGLGVLVTAAQKCASAGGRLRLDNARPGMTRLLAVTGLTGLTTDEPWPHPSRVSARQPGRS